MEDDFPRGDHGDPGKGPGMMQCPEEPQPALRCVSAKQLGLHSMFLHPEKKLEIIFMLLSKKENSTVEIL